MGETSPEVRSGVFPALAMAVLAAVLVGVVCWAWATRPVPDASKLVRNMSDAASAHVSGTVGYSVHYGGNPMDESVTDVSFDYEGDQAHLFYSVGDLEDDGYCEGETYLDGTTRYDLMGGFAVDMVLGGLSSGGYGLRERRTDGVCDFREVLGAMLGAASESVGGAMVTREGSEVVVRLSHDDVSRLRDGLVSRLAVVPGAEALYEGTGLSVTDTDVIGVTMRFDEPSGMLSHVDVSYHPDPSAEPGICFVLDVSLDVSGIGNTHVTGLPESTKASLAS